MTRNNMFLRQMWLVTVLLFILIAGQIAVADPEIDQAIEDLVDTVDMSSATEDIRLGGAGEAGLRFFGVPPNAYAQTDDSKSDAVEKAVAFLETHAVAFAVKSNAVGYDLMRDRAVGTRQYLRFGQSYQGIPVYAGEAIVQMDANEKVSAVISGLMTNTGPLDTAQVSLTPQISVAAAEQAAIESVVDTHVVAAAAENITLTTEEIQAYEDDLIVTEDTELRIYDPSRLLTTGEVALAYEVTVEGYADTIDAFTVLVNAASGATILQIPLVAAALDRNIKDQEHLRILWPTGTLIREEGDLPVPERPDVNRAYDYLGDMYSFYATYHGRDSIDDAGMSLNATVRTCPLILNMACRFSCPCFNAFFRARDNRIYIGDSDDTSDTVSMDADDVIGHEFTHGVTLHESRLKYIGQSGAINESFSDIWGEFSDQTNAAGTDTPEVKWIIGEDTPRSIIRDMQTPPDANHPDRVGSPLLVAPPYSSGLFGDPSGVHKNCGVNNKLCYLLTDGSNGEPDGKFNGRTVSPMGIPLVAALYYECQTNLLTSRADFCELYYALQQAALNIKQPGTDEDLTAEQRSNIDQACRAVEIRPTASITIRGGSAQPLVQITDGGDIVMHGGTIHTEATISPNPAAPEIILRDNDGDPLAMVEPSTGNLYIAGHFLHFDQEGSLSSVPDGSLVVRNAQGRPVACINMDSYMWWDYLIYVPRGSVIVQGHQIGLP